MKLTIVEKKTFLAGLQCTLTSSCAIMDVKILRSVAVKSSLFGVVIGTFWCFSTSILPKNSRKNEGGTFVEFFVSKRSRTMSK